MTPNERQMRARMGALAAHAKHGTRAMTRKARTAWRTRFLDQVDADRALPEDERNRRADHAMRQHMTRMAMRSAKARRTRSMVTPGRVRDASRSLPMADPRPLK